MARLKEKYKKEIVPALVEKFGYTNPMLVPKVEKIAINIGAGDAREDAKLMDKLADELTQITGQKPVVTRAKRSIANFHLREGMPVGCRVTLRHERMYEFLDRLISVALPRVRDFNGVSAKAFDGRGNYTLGVSEQIIFPEIDLEKVDKIKGMNVTIVTSAKTDEECKVLLASFGMPFKR
ncbi:MAG: 50S ribosomal protein L5 [Deltaproteobacteria bacterium]|nr:MAG: 50S ribosomal protein L5 [Deltaproteobacteria bacterium]